MSFKQDKDDNWGSPKSLILLPDHSSSRVRPIGLPGQTVCGDARGGLRRLERDGGPRLGPGGIERHLEHRHALAQEEEVSLVDGDWLAGVAVADELLPAAALPCAGALSAGRPRGALGVRVAEGGKGEAGVAGAALVAVAGEALRPEREGVSKKGSAIKEASRIAAVAATTTTASRIA